MKRFRHSGGNSRLKKTMIMAATVLALTGAALAGFYFWASSGTLSNAGDYSRIDEFKNVRPSLQTPRSQRAPDVHAIMTFNIGYLSGMANNQAKRPGERFFRDRLESFLFLLATTTPDIITFQEIDFFSRRSHYIDQYRAIALNAGYPHGAIAVNWDKKYVPFPYGFPNVHFGPMLSGQAVLSRFPVLSAERMVLDKPEANPFYYNAFYLDRLIQAVEIQVENHRLTVLNIHLEAFDGPTRERQAQKVLEVCRSRRERGPLILIGDFNSVPANAPQKTGFSDEPEADYRNDKTLPLIEAETWLEPAELTILTFPSDTPTRKLDYIFFDRKYIESLSATAYIVDSSDHYPLMMEFRFQ